MLTTSVDGGEGIEEEADCRQGCSQTILRQLSLSRTTTKLRRFSSTEMSAERRGAEQRGKARSR
jgi:hypothetical protein